MAYQKTGFANWIDYDQEIDTIKYGDWTFNPEALGLKREKTAFDPKSINTINDVYKGLGATDQQIQQYESNSAARMLYQQAPALFTGADAYKNSAATQIYNLAKGIKPAPVSNGFFGNSGFGMGGSSNFVGINGQPSNPNSGAIGMGNMGGNLPSAKPTTYNRVKMGSDGMIYLERGDGIPDTQAFAQSVSDMAWSMYNNGESRRHGKNPNDKTESPMRGKAPTQGLLA